MSNIESYLKNVQMFCEKNEIIDDFQCSNMIKPLWSLFDDITRDFNAISHLISSRSRRSAWFSGIGSVMKTVFGTMDEDDSITYHDAIQTLSLDNKKLAKLVKQNIFLSKSAIKNINSTLKAIDDNEERLHDAMNKLSFSLNKSSVVINKLVFKVRTNEVINTLHSNLLTLSYKLEDIVNSILFANSNTLHPSILTPKKLYEELNQNIKYIPKYRKFPVNIELSNINILLKISDLETYYSPNNIIFVLRIPLVYQIDYDLYKTIPVPISHNINSSKSYAMIIPTSNYVALSKDKSTYCTLDDLNSCKSINKEIFACEIPNIVSVNNNPICEIEFMTKVVKTLPSQCKTTFIYGNIDIWQNLGHNSWIFVQSQHTKLSMECNNGTRDIILNGTGIISLEPQCVASCRDVKLLTMYNPKISIPSVNTDFNLIKDNCCNLSKFKELYANASEITISNINLDNLKDLKDMADLQLKNVNDFIEKDNDLFSNHLSFPIITILLSVSFVLLIIYLVFKSNDYFNIKFCKKQQTISENESEDIPVPRLRID